MNNLLGRTFGPTIQLGRGIQSDSMYHFQPHPAELSHLNTNMDILVGRSRSTDEYILVVISIRIFRWIDKYLAPY